MCTRYLQNSSFFIQVFISSISPRSYIQLGHVRGMCGIFFPGVYININPISFPGFLQGMYQCHNSQGTTLELASHCKFMLSDMLPYHIALSQQPTHLHCSHITASQLLNNHPTWLFPYRCISTTTPPHSSHIAASQQPPHLTVPI